MSRVLVPGKPGRPECWPEVGPSDAGCRRRSFDVSGPAQRRRQETVVPAQLRREDDAGLTTTAKWALALQALCSTTTAYTRSGGKGHRLRRSISANSGLVALFCAIGLLFANAAYASHTGQVTGAGSGEGFESPGHVITQRCEDPDPSAAPMGTFPNSDFDIVNNGTYEGVSANPPSVATFNGVSNLTIKTDQYVISPEGTYITCFVPGPIPLLKWEVNSPVRNPTGSVKCQPDPNAGSYERGSFERRAFDKVRFYLRGTCTVHGPGGTTHVTDQTTTHILEGTMHPCETGEPLPPGSPPTVPCANPNATALVVTDYKVVSELVPTQPITPPATP